MNLLQRLVTNEMAKNRSLREIAESIGISHVSLSKYYKGTVRPEGKNLSVIAAHFGVEFWELLEEEKDKLSDDPVRELVDGMIDRIFAGKNEAEKLAFAKAVSEIAAGLQRD